MALLVHSRKNLRQSASLREAHRTVWSATPLANIVRGILPGGQPWVIRALSAEVRADGRIHVDGRDLLIANGQSVFATLICGPLPNGPFTLHSTHAVALAAYGDFTIDDILSPAPSNPCDNPVLLIRNVGGVWFAAGIPLVIND